MVQRSFTKYPYRLWEIFHGARREFCGDEHTPRTQPFLDYTKNLAEKGQSRRKRKPGSKRVEKE
jgi:hypothetical protein